MLYKLAQEYKKLPSGSSRPTLQRQPDGVFHATWLRPDSTRVHALWSPMGRVQTPLPLRSVAAACDHLGRPLPIPRRQLTAGSGVTYLTEKN